MIKKIEKLNDKEPVFIYDPKKREWKTIYVPISPERQKLLDETNKNQGWNNKKPFSYTLNTFKRTKTNYQYKSTKPSKIKQKYKGKYK